MDKNRRENSLFSSLFLYRSRKTDCFPVCYTKIDRKTDGLAMGIFPALFPSKTWPYNGFLEPCFLALRLGKICLNPVLCSSVIIHILPKVEVTLYKMEHKQLLGSVFM